MHPFVHAFTPAIDPPWEAKTDFEMFHLIARELSELAETHLGTRKDLVSVPLQHDTPGETAQPGGVVRDWSARRRPADPGQDHAGAAVVVERDYTAIADKLATVGPLADTLGFTVKNVTYRLEEQVAPLAQSQRRDARRCRRRPAGDRHRRQDGRGDPDASPAPPTASWPSRASGPWRSGSASRCTTWPRARRRSGSPSPTPRQAPVPVITSPEWSGSETGGRRYAPFTVNIERLKPFHTLTGRMHFFLDHDWMTRPRRGAADLPATAGHAPAVRRAGARPGRRASRSRCAT